MEYTEEEREQARKTLGIVDSEGKSIGLEERSKEALIETIRLINARTTDRNVAHSAAMDAMEKRLKSARKAKALANRRADVALKTMADMLEAFSKFQIKED